MERLTPIKDAFFYNWVNTGENIPDKDFNNMVKRGISKVTVHKLTTKKLAETPVWSFGDERVIKL